MAVKVTATASMVGGLKGLEKEERMTGKDMISKRAVWKTPGRTGKTGSQDDGRVAGEKGKCDVLIMYLPRWNSTLTHGLHDGRAFVRRSDRKDSSRTGFGVLRRDMNCCGTGVPYAPFP